MSIVHRLDLAGSGSNTFAEDLDGRVMRIPQGFRIAQGFMTTETGAPGTVGIDVGVAGDPDAFGSAALPTGGFSNEPFKGVLINVPLALDGDLPLFVVRNGTIGTNVILTLYFEGFRIL